MKEKLESLEWRIKSFFKDFKAAAKAKLEKVWIWIANNLETIIPLIPLIVCIIKVVASLMIKHSDGKRHDARIAEERDLKDRYIYDRSAGFYWHLTRDISQGEKMAIDQRHREGESYSKILSDMRLL